MSQPQRCRACGSTSLHTVVDLGASPLSNAYLSADALAGPEVFYPLHAKVCEACFLVQLPELVAPSEIFTDYAYFSSYSSSWSAHAAQYAELMVAELSLGPSHTVVEVASNDGYLLRHFHDRGIRVLGIEPARNVADVARAAGIDTLSEFFGRGLAERLVSEGVRADLLAGNNVLAHVPDLHDFVAGLSVLLAPRGTLTMEFPHLLRLLERNQFDTIYHEHFSYLSVRVVERLFARHGLALVHVEELPTHGGSVRVVAAHAAEGRARGDSVDRVLQLEDAAGLSNLGTYLAFGARVQQTKRRLLAFLIEQHERGRRVAGYGAPAKANTLLNYCGIRSDLIEYTVDLSPHKQGRFLPGTRIPVHAPSRLAETRPDVIVILPWNLRDEIAASLAHTRAWGAQLVVPIPTVDVVA